MHCQWPACTTNKLSVWLFAGRRAQTLAEPQSGPVGHIKAVLCIPPFTKHSPTSLIFISRVELGHNTANVDPPYSCAQRWLLQQALLLYVKIVYLSDGDTDVRILGFS